MSWQDSIYFEKGEKMVAWWEGDRETAEKAVVRRGNYGHRVQDVKQRKWVQTFSFTGFKIK